MKKRVQLAQRRSYAIRLMKGMCGDLKERHELWKKILVSDGTSFSEILPALPYPAGMYQSFIDPPPAKARLQRTLGLFAKFECPRSPLGTAFVLRTLHEDGQSEQRQNQARLHLPTLHWIKKPPKETINVQKRKPEVRCPEDEA